MSEKLFNWLAILICIMIISMIVFFIVSFIQLKNYKECIDINFNSVHCEKYKDY